MGALTTGTVTLTVTFMPSLVLCHSRFIRLVGLSVRVASLACGQTGQTGQTGQPSQAHATKRALPKYCTVLYRRRLQYCIQYSNGQHGRHQAETAKQTRTDQTRPDLTVTLARVCIALHCTALHCILGHDSLDMQPAGHTDTYSTRYITAQYQVTALDCHSPRIVCRIR